MIWDLAEKTDWKSFCDDLDKGNWGVLHYFFFENIAKDIGTRIENELNEISHKISTFHFDPKALYIALSEYLEDNIDKNKSTFWETYHFLKINGIDPNTAKVSAVFAFFLYNSINARTLEAIKPTN